MTSEAIAFLLTEILYGTTTSNEGTTFLEGDQALIATLQSLTPEQASQQPQNLDSIAANLIHLNAYLGYTIATFKQQEPAYDWPGTWAKQIISEDEYNAEIQKLQTQAEQFTNLLNHVPLEQKWPLVETIANLCHLSYHLGAIRQLARIVKHD